MIGLAVTTRECMRSATGSAFRCVAGELSLAFESISDFSSVRPDAESPASLEAEPGTNPDGPGLSCTNGAVLGFDTRMTPALAVLGFFGNFPGDPRVRG